jgi:hypothetical protein
MQDSVEIKEFKITEILGSIKIAKWIKKEYLSKINVKMKNKIWYNQLITLLGANIMRIFKRIFSKLLEFYSNKRNNTKKSPKKSCGGWISLISCKYMGKDN